MYWLLLLSYIPLVLYVAYLAEAINYTKPKPGAPL